MARIDGLREEVGILLGKGRGKKMARYVNERIGSYVPVSQYMGTLGANGELDQYGIPIPVKCSNQQCVPAVDCLDKIRSTAIVNQLSGILTGVIGFMAVSWIYGKVKGK